MYWGKVDVKLSLSYTVIAYFNMNVVLKNSHGFKPLFGNVLARDTNKTLLQHCKAVKEKYLNYDVKKHDPVFQILFFLNKREIIDISFWIRYFIISIYFQSESRIICKNSQQKISMIVYYFLSNIQGHTQCMDKIALFINLYSSEKILYF